MTVQYIENFVKEHNIPWDEFSVFDIESVLDDLSSLKENSVYVEIGVKGGKSLTVARLSTKPTVKVYGIDIEIRPETVEYLKRAGIYNNLNFIEGNSQELWKEWNEPIDFLFIDGNHDYEPVKIDIGEWSKFVKPGGLIFLHDCNESSPGVWQAVTEFVWTHEIEDFRLMRSKRKRTSLARIKL